MQSELAIHMQNNEAGHLPNTLQENEFQTDERPCERPKSINTLKEKLRGNLIN